MNKILSITTALAALAEVKRHEEAADAVTVGEASDPSGTDDEERLAQDRRRPRSPRCRRRRRSSPRLW